MQPKSKVKVDYKSLESIKKTMKSIDVPRRERKNNPSYATELPEILGLKLTNRCNLRCKHCYEWNEEGYHQSFGKTEQNMELDFDVLKKAIKETQITQSRLYLWGGEPLCYSKFDEMSELLKNENREITMCTNALLIKQKISSILKMSDSMELLIPMEGFEEEHDELRGVGNFKQVMDSIEFLKDLKVQGIFHGKISIHTVINDGMIGKLYELLEFFEDKNVDFVMLCYPWYISDQTSQEMDEYYAKNFQWMGPLKEKPSWHSFKYKIDASNVPELIKDIKKINSRVWNIRVRYQPGLEYDEIEKFVLGSSDYKIRQEHCLAISNRMDIVPEGTVSACKFFNEIFVDNLKDKSIAEVWHSKRYKRIREIIYHDSMPVCSKCSALYLNGG